MITKLPHSPVGRPSQEFLRALRPWRPPARESHAPEPLDLSDVRLVAPIPEAARAAAAAVDPWASPPPDEAALEDALATATGRNPEEVFVARGAERVVEALCWTLLQDGDRVVVSSPSWPSLPRAALVAGARYVDLGRDQAMRPRVDTLARILEDQRPKLALLADPDPVTGTPVPAALYERLHEAGVTTVVDRSCAPSGGQVTGFFPGTPQTHGPQPPPSVVLVDSLSVRAGLSADPVGWVLGPPALVQTLRCAFPRSGISHAARAAALATLGEPPSLERLADPWRARTQRLLVALSQERASLGSTSPAPAASLQVSASRGPALWLGVRGVAAVDLAVALWREGLRVAAQPRDPAWHDGVSLAVPSEAVMDRTIGALRRALRALRPGARGETPGGGRSRGVALSVLLALALPMSLFMAADSAAGCGAPTPPSPPASHAAQAPLRRAPETRAPIRPAPPATASRSPSAGAAAQSGDAAKETPPPKGVWKPLHRAPFVGGCGRSCARPEDALRGFLEALAQGPEGDAQEVARFLNTAELRVDGGSQGAELARRWRQGDLEGRGRLVEALIRDLSKGLGPQARDALAQAARAAQLHTEPRAVSCMVDLPPLGSRWRVSLARRGLEWLVVAVDRR